MRISKLWAILAPAALLLSLHLICPISAHADTYQFTRLAIENNHYFYGMDDLGTAVFSVYAQGAPGCPYSAATCYQEIGVSGYTTTPPNLAWDYASKTCSYNCSLTYGGRTVTISANPRGEQDLSISYGSGPSQVLFTTGFGGIFALNGVGDIVFDDGSQGEWMEAFVVPTVAAALTTATTVPEPSALLLLATGILAPIFFLRRRSNLAAL